MKLPNPQRAQVPRAKIEDYLLSPVHSVGRHKAAFFNALGYTQADWQILRNDLLDMAPTEAREVARIEYGVKYEIRGTITGPAGRSAAIVAAWIVLNNEDFPRFVSAYPED